MRRTRRRNSATVSTLPGVSVRRTASVGRHGVVSQDARLHTSQMDDERAAEDSERCVESALAGHQGVREGVISKGRSWTR